MPRDLRARLDRLGSLDYLGWTDAKRPKLSYVVVPVDGELRGVLLCPAGNGLKANRKATRVWCED